MVEEKVCCRYEGDSSQGHLEESTLNMTGRVRGEMARAREGRERAGKIRNKASQGPRECVENSMSPNWLNYMGRKAGGREALVSPGFKRFRVRGRMRSAGSHGH